jgi:hypothetical protein
LLKEWNFRALTALPEENLHVLEYAANTVEVMALRVQRNSRTRMRRQLWAAMRQRNLVETVVDALPTLESGYTAAEHTAA